IRHRENVVVRKPRLAEPVQRVRAELAGVLLDNTEDDGCSRRGLDVAIGVELWRVDPVLLAIRLPPQDRRGLEFGFKPGAHAKLRRVEIGHDDFAGAVESGGAIAAWARVVAGRQHGPIEALQQGELDDLAPAAAQIFAAIKHGPIPAQMRRKPTGTPRFAGRNNRTPGPESART